jgi:hypothetical protein
VFRNWHLAIKTRSKETKWKKHDKLKVHIELNSQPIDLDIEAENVTETAKDKTRNLNKVSFAKIPFINGFFEGYTYKNSDALFLVFSENASAKTNIMHSDYRRLTEIFNLVSKMRYYSRLSPEQKLNYLRLHSNFANINIVRRKDNA